MLPWTPHSSLPAGGCRKGSITASVWNRFQRTWGSPYCWWILLLAFPLWKWHFHTSLVFWNILSPPSVHCFHAYALDAQPALQSLLLLTALFELIKLYSAGIKRIMAGTVINGTTAGKSPASFWDADAAKMCVSHASSSKHVGLWDFVTVQKWCRSYLMGFMSIVKIVRWESGTDIFSIRIHSIFTTPLASSEYEQLCASETF